MQYQIMRNEAEFMDRWEELKYNFADLVLNEEAFATFVVWALFNGNELTVPGIKDQFEARVFVRDLIQLWKQEDLGILNN